MSSQVIPISDKAFPCPLCHGTGQLTRAEALDRLGASDFKEIAQTSAQEALRLMIEKRRDDWERFDGEVKERTKPLEDEIRRLNLDPDRFRKTGRKEEMTFAEEARSWPGIYLSDKLSKGGDYILAYRGPTGLPLEPEILVDNKEGKIGDDDIGKLVRDAKKRAISVAVVVAKDESKLRSVDWENSFGYIEDILVLRTTRQLLRAQLDVLRPITDAIRARGPEFVRNNADLAEQVKRTLSDLSAIQKEINGAAEASRNAGQLLTKYAEQLRTLCDNCLKRSELQACPAMEELTAVQSEEEATVP